ncbi:MAG: hypothetical protein ACI8XM_000192 [Haloarculaceae archaeon]|jgi:hypothetical protein
MYENEPTAYGYKMTFGGFIDDEEMAAWANEVESQLDQTPDEWHCYVDMRPLETMSADGQQRMAAIKRECHDCGLTRVATVVDSPTVRLQFEQMSEGTGGSGNERYLDAQTTENPEETAIAWVRDSVDPGA